MGRGGLLGKGVKEYSTSTDIKFRSRSWDDEIEVAQESSSEKASSLPLTPRFVGWVSDLHRCHLGARRCGSGGGAGDAGPGPWEAEGCCAQHLPALVGFLLVITHSRVCADPHLEMRHLRSAK